ncbi:MAG: NAD-dependent DNA ligase LigA [Candidatus Omnitrophota bacterium]
MDNIKKKIDELRKQIIKHNVLYYAEGTPKISDEAYDVLIKELKKLEKEYPEYASSGSPTGTVGSPIPDKFSKVKHTAPMLSLESVNDEEGALRFDKTCRKEAGDDVGYMCEPKLDGISIELVYEDGEFVRGSTRGNGMIGEDVTLNLKTIKNIPLKLKTKNPPERIAVRGEVVMHISDFNELNKQQVKNGKEPFANPRNVAAGSMRQLDHKITGERKLHVYCYRILDLTDKMPVTQEETLKVLESYEFQVSPKTKYCRKIEEAIAYHHNMETQRDDLDYEIDGIVIKVDSTLHQAKLGMRTTNPKWAVAYKFKARKEITRVEDIVVQVGRTGVLTPLAFLQSVDISGVTVSRATLHNMDQVERLGVKIGDYVKVERAGDVIPYITEVVIKKRTGSEKTFHMPKNCPSCGTPLEKEDVFYRCPAGLSCPAQVKEAISHYASKDAADIEGLSDKTVEQLFDNGIIKRTSDIYGLKKEELLVLEGWKEKKTNNLLNAIKKAKDISLDRFIFALGIRNVGRHIAAVLADRFGNLENIMSAKEEELMLIKEIGPEIAKSIKTFFSGKKNLKEIKKLKESEIIIKKWKKKIGKLTGKRIVFTGTLQKTTRQEAKKLVEKEGGEVLSSVGPSTDILVAGEKAGSKLTQAKKLGIKIFTEEELLKLIK